MSRIPPSDLLTDEKSLTTSAPQSQRRESRCLGFILVEANLLGMHLLPWRKPFAEAAPAAPNLLVALREDIPVGREIGSDPSGTRHSSILDFSGTETVSDPYGINCPSGLEFVGSGTSRTSLRRRVRPRFFRWWNTVVTCEKRICYARYKV